MQYFIMVAFVFIQCAILILALIHLIRSFNPTKRRSEQFRLWYLVLELSLFILLGFCFVSYEMSSFRNEKYFTEFAILTCIAVVFYVMNKINFKSFKMGSTLALSGTATLFWLSFFTAIKFIPYLPYVWFPLLGFLAITPLFLAILCLSEIRYLSMLRTSFNTIHILFFGLVPVILLTLVLNLFSEENWGFILLFNPLNTSI